MIHLSQSDNGNSTLIAFGRQRSVRFAMWMISMGVCLFGFTSPCRAQDGKKTVPESRFEQAVPAPTSVQSPTARRAQAVVLIHGYKRQGRDEKVAAAEFHPWQLAESQLVKELSRQADVFRFAYGQNVEIDAIVGKSKLFDSVQSLRRLDYHEIVLVGHSAGGLIARHFVEDFPEAGVTKVLQVCAPNGGSGWAMWKGRESQQVFLDGLTIKGRQKSLQMRDKKVIPNRVHFLCVVARKDGFVSPKFQWTEDLRKQGIPAVGMDCGHTELVDDANDGVNQFAVKLGNLLCEPQPRWNAERVDQACREILGDSENVASSLGRS